MNLFRDDTTPAPLLNSTTHDPIPFRASEASLPLSSQLKKRGRLGGAFYPRPGSTTCCKTFLLVQKWCLFLRFPTWVCAAKVVRAISPGDTSGLRWTRLSSQQTKQCPPSWLPVWPRRRRPRGHSHIVSWRVPRTCAVVTGSAL